MQKKVSVFSQILTEICQEYGIDLTWLSSGWIAQLDRSNRRRYIVGHKFDLNTAASALTADDKYATFEILHAAGVPVIEHQIIYESSNHEPYAQGKNTLEYALKYFNTHQKHIVIKPNLGQCGVNVCQIIDASEIMPVLEKVFHQAMSASLCPFYHIQHEYRAILLDGEERLSYQKNLSKGWKFNLSQGATAQAIVDEDLHRQIIRVAKQAAQALNLRFCSVDVIETVDNELLVMEVNSGVMTEKYLGQYPKQRNLVKAIYREAVHKMFEG